MNVEVEKPRLTAVGRSTQREGSLRLPGISFCPGFRPSEEEEARLSWVRPGLDYGVPSRSRIVDERAANASAEHERAWRAMTVDPSDVFVRTIFEKEDGSFEVRSATQLEDNGGGEAGRCVRAESHNTLSGRCFVLFPECPLANGRSLQLVTNLSLVSRLPLHFHHPRALVGLNEELWPLLPRAVTVHAGTNSYIGLSKKVK